MKVLVSHAVKPSMQDFNQDLPNVGGECSWPVVSTLCSAILLGNWDEDFPFPDEYYSALK